MILLVLFLGELFGFELYFYDLLEEAFLRFLEADINGTLFGFGHFVPRGDDLSGGVFIVFLIIDFLSDFYWIMLGGGGGVGQVQMLLALPML